MGDDGLSIPTMPIGQCDDDTKAQCATVPSHNTNYTRHLKSYILRLPPESLR